MRLNYVNLGFEYSLDNIMFFETGEQSEYWRSSLFYFYPQLDKEKADKLDIAARREYYSGVLRGIYDEIQPQWTEKLEKYNAYWQEHEQRVNDAFSEQFGRDVSGSFQDIQGRIALNCVEPRFLSERAFDMFWRNSERGAMGIALHEMTHIVWFDEWKKHFKDDENEYESPNLKWILSEMVVECYLSHPVLRALNPYFERENGGCIYPYFYNLDLDGVPLRERLKTLFVPGKTVDFMEATFEMVKKYEDQIRTHIEKEEEKLA